MNNNDETACERPDDQRSGMGDTKAEERKRTKRDAREEENGNFCETFYVVCGLWFCIMLMPYHYVYYTKLEYHHLVILEQFRVVPEVYQKRFASIFAPEFESVLVPFLHHLLLVSPLSSLSLLSFLPHLIISPLPCCLDFFLGAFVHHFEL